MQLTSSSRGRGALAAVVAAILAASVGPAAANPYETFVAVESEEDLYDLRVTEQIDDETLATLTELYQRGVDLNRATREELYSLPNLTYAEVDAILEYRELAGWIRDPIDLVVSGVLSQEKLEAMAAFLVVTDPSRALFSTDGWVRAQTRWSVEDEGAPPASLQARVSTLQNLTVGVASTLVQGRLGEVDYDPAEGALTAEPPGTGVVVPKFYAKWETEEWGVIAGTYRVGFGQRLTFDNTSLYTPNGFYLDDELFRDTSLVRECKESAADDDQESPCAGPAGDVYVTPDYRWRDGLLGVAAGLKKLEVGKGHLEAYAFASYQPRSIYQYELYDRGICADPRIDDEEQCAAPPIFRRLEPGEEPSRFSFSTLPNMFAEMTAGGHVAYAVTRRARIGATGYGAGVDWLVDGIDLDFQEWSRLPYGGPFGAVGVDGAFGIDKHDLFAEVTRSFDSMGDAGGGLGALVRWVTTFRKQNELEVAFRYYDEDFKNAYARPIAAADELDGSRARDEMGIRARYNARLYKRLSLRTSADVWQSPSDSITDVIVYARSDVDLTAQYGVGLWGLYQNKDTGTNGVGECFEVPTEEDEDGESIPCAGEKYQAVTRFRFSPTPLYSLVVQGQYDLVADPGYMDEFRRDVSASLQGSARPIDRLRFRGRVRYLSEDIGDDTALEESVWAYADATWRLRERDRLRVRYDTYVYLDDRMSTAERVPSPEHWLWLEFESRF